MQLLKYPIINFMRLRIPAMVLSTVLLGFVRAQALIALTGADFTGGTLIEVE